jgi:hypothetical protein
MPKIPVIDQVRISQKNFNLFGNFLKKISIVISSNFLTTMLVAIRQSQTKEILANGSVQIKGALKTYRRST